MLISLSRQDKTNSNKKKIGKKKKKAETTGLESGLIMVLVELDLGESRSEDDGRGRKAGTPLFYWDFVPTEYCR
jgi:hypothetical protein